MQTNIIKIFAVIISSIIFTSAIHAQDKPQASKFDKYNQSENISVFESLAERFIFSLKQEPETTVGVIGITERGVLGGKFKEILRQHPELKNRIGYYFGKGIRNSPPLSGFPVEFWLVPKDAEIPNLGDYDPPCECPTLTVEGENLSAASSLITFNAQATGGDEDDEITYNWKVSAGEIVEGQNTPVIRVDAKGAKQVTATIEIGGVCEECVREASATVKIEEKLKLVVVVGRSADEPVKMQLDILLNILKNNPTMRAYIINYGSRAGGRRDFARRKWIIAQYFQIIKADTSRITLIDGGNRKEETTELWISTDENQKPEPTPAVDVKSVGVPATPKSRKSNFL